jgi:hypothetical protein
MSALPEASQMQNGRLPHLQICVENETLESQSVSIPRRGWCLEALVHQGAPAIVSCFMLVP